MGLDHPMRPRLMDVVHLHKAMRELYTEDKPCEHRHHNLKPEHHEGLAKWYAHSACPACGNDWGLIAFCDKFARIVGTGVLMKCGDCDHYGDAGTFYKKWYRI